MIDDRSAAAIALTSRLVDSDVKPMSPREYWDLAQRVAPSRLLGRRATDIASRSSIWLRRMQNVWPPSSIRGTGLADRVGAAGSFWNLDHCRGDECYR